jgi:hypothetical protein
MGTEYDCLNLKRIIRKEKDIVILALPPNP